VERVSGENSIRGADGLGRELWCLENQTADKAIKMRPDNRDETLRLHRLSLGG